MTRVLITGMSGTGKSAVVRDLAARGCRAFDLGTPEWSHWIEADPADALTPAPGKDWVWREDRVRALLSGPQDGPLFIAGCAEKMERLYASIDLVLLLTAPLGTIMQRLAGRSPAGYGHTVEERRKVAGLIASIEPLLREAADGVIDTTGPVSATVDEVLRRVAAFEAV